MAFVVIQRRHDDSKGSNSKGYEVDGIGLMTQVVDE